MGLLEQLLADKTTKTNIIWATDAYQELGNDYQRDKEIKIPLITGINSDVIKTRARKAMEQQSERTRRHAEVFTPLWICHKMVSHADSIWFGEDDAFLDAEQPTQCVQFPHRKKWQHYVDSRRLEITCGEAPYLVNRYDVSTGESIALVNRQGILDRKLRVVNENAVDEAEWLKWSLRAFQSTYGYEFQGDNLLIARVNLLMTFEEYLYARWKRKPTLEEYRGISKTIAWNIWQMDGLSGTIPYCKADEEFHQFSLFEWFDYENYQEKVQQQPCCRIYDWRRGNSLEYTNVNKGGRNMKFDFVIGNPPYQEETVEEVSQSNGQAPRKNIFHYFQMEADKVADCATVLIYPAGRWIHRAGKGMDAFGMQQINDVHLKKLIFYPDSRDVFSGVAIADGVGIVIKDAKKQANGFEYVYCRGNETISINMQNPGEELMPLNPNDLSIIEKVKRFVGEYDLDYLHNRILSRSLFGIESSFVENNPQKVIPLECGMDIDYAKKIKLFTNDKSGKAGRAKWYIADKDVIKNNANFIGQWKVVVSSANAGGQKRDNQLEIIDNHSAFGRARVALASFENESEAINFYNYVNSYVVKFMFLMTDESLTSLGKRVPDLMDYTDNNTFIDFSHAIDEQLYSLIGLEKIEIQYIKEVVDNIRKKKTKGDQHGDGE